MKYSRHAVWKVPSCSPCSCFQMSMNVIILKQTSVTSTLSVTTLEDRTPVPVRRDIREMARTAQVRVFPCSLWMAVLAWLSQLIKVPNIPVIKLRFYETYDCLVTDLASDAGIIVDIVIFVLSFHAIAVEIILNRC